MVKKPLFFSQIILVNKQLTIKKQYTDDLWSHKLNANILRSNMFTPKQTMNTQTESLLPNRHCTLKQIVYSQTNNVRSTQKFIFEQTLYTKQKVYNQANILRSNKKCTVKQTLFAQPKSL